MFRFRILDFTILLLACLFAAAASAGDLIRFISPTSDEFLLGSTHIQLDVANSAPLVDRVDLYVRGRLIGTALPPEWSCTWDAGSEDCGAGIVAVVYADDEMVGRVRLRTREFYFGESIEVPVVQLYPVVVDRRGRYVKHLEKDDFSVIDNGGRMEIEYFSTEATSLSIAILLDVSESMVGKLDMVRDASCGFVDKLNEEDVISVYAFNHALRRVLAASRDHDQIKHAVNTLHASGGTALYDALVSVLEDMKSETGRRAVFLFSDGLDEISLTSLESAVEAARNSEAIIYAVGAGDDDRSVKARDDLRAMAEETGGDAYFIDTVKDLPPVFDSVLNDLRAQYVLSYPAPKGPPGRRSLKVRCTKRSYRVRCRKSYLHGSS